jgi:hypothetical protein
MQGVVDNERPPYITFETRQAEDRDASIAKGHYVEKDIEIVVITRAGAKDDLHRVALEWLTEQREKARRQLIPQAWYDSFNAQYKAWKEGQELPANGTPILGWVLLSPSVQKDLIRAGIRTVEDLSEIADSELQQITMGALGYKLKAKNWLEAASGTGKTVEKLTALSIQVSELVELTKKLQTENERLRAFEPKPTTAKA